MTQAFLNSLKGLSGIEAETAVASAGHYAYTVENGDAMALVALPNTVILWLDENNLVSTASAGDTLELR